MEIRFIGLRVIFYRGSGWNANFGFGACVLGRDQKINTADMEEHPKAQRQPRRKIWRREAADAEKTSGNRCPVRSDGSGDAGYELSGNGVDRSGREKDKQDLSLRPG